MENVRRHVNIELLTSSKFAAKRIAKPNFEGSKRFHDELFGVELTRSNVELNKPIQVGLAILDLSKEHMYNAYYNVLLEHFPHTELLFTDTDSFCVAIEHPDVYGEMATFKDWFDFSEYPRDHPLYDESNRKVVGKFKDECTVLVWPSSWVYAPSSIRLSSLMIKDRRTERTLPKESKSALRTTSSHLPTTSDACVRCVWDKFR